MRREHRQILSIVLAGIGFALLLWGSQMHALPVFSEDNDKGFATAESVLIKEVSIGGLKREADGKLYKTYTGEAPQACPT